MGTAGFKINIEDLEKEIIKILKTRDVKLRINDGEIALYQISGFYGKKSIHIHHFKKSTNTRFFVYVDEKRINESYSLQDLHKYSQEL